MQLHPSAGEGWSKFIEVELQAHVEEREFLEPGWQLKEGGRLATFTTSRPSAKPGRKPAGLRHCDEASRARWKADWHRYPPYQYKPEFCVHHHSTQAVRVASVAEREVILGFPLHYTQHCMSKQHRHGDLYEDTRKTLLGNSWSVPVVAILMKSLFERRGIVDPWTVQQVVDNLTPGKGSGLQMILQRPPLRRLIKNHEGEDNLATRMAGLVKCRSRVKIFYYRILLRCS